MHLKLQKFDPTSIDNTRTWLVVGRRGSGKSSMIKDFLYHHRRSNPYGVVFSATEEANEAYGSIFPNLYIHNEYNEDVLQKVILNQKKLRRQGSKDGCYVVLDDVLFDKKVMNSKTIRQALYNGRHWGLQLFVVAQYVVDVPSALRSQFDVVVVMMEPSANTRKRINDYWLSALTYKQTNQLLDATTQNYEGLVIVNYRPSTDLSKICFWYKANPNLPPFRCGSTAFWEHAQRNYDDNWEERADAKEAAEKGTVPNAKNKSSTIIITKKKKKKI